MKNSMAGPKMAVIYVLNDFTRLETHLGQRVSYF